MRMHFPRWIFAGIMGFLIFAGLIGFPPASSAGQKEYEACMLKMLTHAGSETTAGQIRAACLPCLEKQAAAAMPEKKESKVDTSLVDADLLEKKEAERPRFALHPHNANYLLPLAYNSKPNDDPATWRGGSIDHTEVKFQISFKHKLVDNLYQNNWDLYAAYTNLSFWQAYNDEISSPFRETNHEPEIWLQYGRNRPFLGMTNEWIRLGLSHQSNGRGGTASRSWNRLVADFQFHKDNFTLRLKPWYRIPESAKDYLGDSGGDDNPDIDRYLGYGEIHAAFDWRAHRFTMMVRNNLRAPHNRATIELGWIFPFYGQLKGYVQYFYGYGESLIDYDALTHRIGLGVLLSSW